MSIVYHERPGVYSDYTVSRVTASGGGRKTVGMVGVSPAQAGLYTLTAYHDAVAAFGADSSLCRMVRHAIEAGAGKILAYSIPEATETAYSDAISALLAEGEQGFYTVDSDLSSVQLRLKTAVEAASRNKAESLCVLGMTAPTKQALLDRAAALNSPRAVLVGPDVLAEGQTEYCGGPFAAAALCGLLSGQTDPALPLSGARLPGFAGVSDRFEETEIDALVRGGVTVLEAEGGQVTVLRAVTTKTTEGSAPDDTFREVNTMLVLDDVIPGIRQALAARFARAKNNAVTRSAIRNLVIVELEGRLSREIIDSYDGVTVEASSTDATTCLVSFGFTVTHGLNHIYLTAHISV